MVSTRIIFTDKEQILKESNIKCKSIYTKWWYCRMANVVFKHNQHQIDEEKTNGKRNRFNSFKEVYTRDFWSKEDGEKLEFKVGDEDYKLEPSTLDKSFN